MFNQTLRARQHHLSNLDMMLRSLIKSGIYYLAAAKRTFHIRYFFRSFIN